LAGIGSGPLQPKTIPASGTTHAHKGSWHSAIARRSRQLADTGLSDYKATATDI